MNKMSGAAGGGISSTRPERSRTSRRPVTVQRHGVQVEVQGWGGVTNVSDGYNRRFQLFFAVEIRR